jgi:hypothetical protein
MANFSNYSLYSNTSNDGVYRDYYEPVSLEADDSDYYILVTSEYNHKPGKLAYDLYGSERLGWVFSYYNRDKINDPIFDLESGMIIKVPAKDHLLRCL